MKTVHTVTTGPVLLAGRTLPWMITSADSLRRVDTAPGTTTVNGHPSPSAESTMEMAMDAVHPRGPGSRTTHLPVEPTMTPMMPGLHPLRARMMTLTSRGEPTAVLALPHAVNTWLTSAHATGKRGRHVFSLWMLLQMIVFARIPATYRTGFYGSLHLSPFAEVEACFPGRICISGFYVALLMLFTSPSLFFSESVAHA